MYQAVVLFCAVAIQPVDCQKDNAAQVVKAPEAQESMAGCAVYGMQFAAESNLGQAGYYAKIRCEEEHG